MDQQQLFSWIHGISQSIDQFRRQIPNEFTMIFLSLIHADAIKGQETTPTLTPHTININKQHFQKMLKNADFIHECLIEHRKQKYKNKN